MAGEATIAQYEGLTKRVEGKLVNVIPDAKKWPWLNAMKMKPGQMLGEEFTDTIEIEEPTGFTISRGGLVDYKAPKTGATKRALGKAWELHLTEQVAYDILYQAAKAGEQAFEAAYAKIRLAMMRATFGRLELNARCGGLPLGIAISGAGGVVYAGGGATTATIVLSKGSVIPSAFIGKNPRLDVYDNNAGVYTKLNDNGSPDHVPVTVTGTVFDGTNITLSVSGLAADLAAIDGAQDTRAVEIWHEGARDDLGLVETLGGYGVARLQAGDTYLGIPVNSAPNFWRGTRLDAEGATLSTTLIEKLAMDMALMIEEGEFFLECSNICYRQISAQLQSASSIVRVTHQEGTQTMGSKRYELITGGGGVTIRWTRFNPIGSALLWMPSEDTIRIGAAEASRDIPGVETPPLERLITKTGIQLVNYSNARLWCRKPRHFGEIFNLSTT